MWFKRLLGSFFLDSDQYVDLSETVFAKTLGHMDMDRARLAKAGLTLTPCLQL